MVALFICEEKVYIVKVFTNKDTASINQFCSERVQLTQPLGASFCISSFIGLKQREMEMEEGSARVSWYESQLLIGPNNFFHRLVCTWVDSGRLGLVLVE